MSEQKRAAAEYKAGAAQRDPKAVRDANANAKSGGNQSAGRGGSK
ncbi:hypothetical protein [Streptomyces anulatus]